MDQQLRDLQRDLNKKIARAKPVVESFEKKELLVPSDEQQRLLDGYPRWVQDLEHVKKGEMPPVRASAHPAPATADDDDAIVEEEPVVAAAAAQEEEQEETTASSSDSDDDDAAALGWADLSRKQLVQRLHRSAKPVRKAQIDAYVARAVPSGHLLALTKKCEALHEQRRAAAAAAAPESASASTAFDSAKKEHQLEARRVKEQSDKVRHALTAEIAELDAQIEAKAEAAAKAQAAAAAATRRAAVSKKQERRERAAQREQREQQLKVEQEKNATAVADGGAAVPVPQQEMENPFDADANDDAERKKAEAEKKRHEAEEAAAAKKKADDEAAAAAEAAAKRAEREAAIAKKRAEDEAAAVEAKKKKKQTEDDEAAAAAEAAAKRAEREAAIAKKRAEDEAAAAAEKKKKQTAAVPAPAPAPAPAAEPSDAESDDAPAAAASGGGDDGDEDGGDMFGCAMFDVDTQAKHDSTRVKDKAKDDKRKVAEDAERAAREKERAAAEAAAAAEEEVARAAKAEPKELDWSIISIEKYHNRAPSPAPGPRTKSPVKAPPAAAASETAAAAAAAAAEVSKLAAVAKGPWMLAEGASVTPSPAASPSSASPSSSASDVVLAARIASELTALLPTLPSNVSIASVAAAPTSAVTVAAPVGAVARWRINVAPHDGPLAGFIVPLALTFTRYFPFEAPVLQMLVDVPHHSLGVSTPEARHAIDLSKKSSSGAGVFPASAVPWSPLSSVAAVVGAISHLFDARCVSALHRSRVSAVHDALRSFECAETGHAHGAAFPAVREVFNGPWENFYPSAAEMRSQSSPRGSSPVRRATSPPRVLSPSSSAAAAAAAASAALPTAFSANGNGQLAWAHRYGAGKHTITISAASAAASSSSFMFGVLGGKEKCEVEIDKKIVTTCEITVDDKAETVAVEIRAPSSSASPLLSKTLSGAQAQPFVRVAGKSVKDLAAVKIVFSVPPVKSTAASPNKKKNAADDAKTNGGVPRCAVTGASDVVLGVGAEVSRSAKSSGVVTAIRTSSQLVSSDIFPRIQNLHDERGRKLEVFVPLLLRVKNKSAAQQQLPAIRSAMMNLTRRATTGAALLYTPPFVTATATHTCALLLDGCAADVVDALFVGGSELSDSSKQYLEQVVDKYVALFQNFAALAVEHTQMADEAAKAISGWTRSNSNSNSNNNNTNNSAGMPFAYATITSTVTWPSVVRTALSAAVPASAPSCGLDDEAGVFKHITSGAAARATHHVLVAAALAAPLKAPLSNLAASVGDAGETQQLRASMLQNLQQARAVNGFDRLAEHLGVMLSGRDLYGSS